MISAISRNRNLIQYLLLIIFIIIIAIFASMQVQSISDKIYNTYEDALHSKGGRFEALIIMVAPIFMLIWLWLIFIKKEYLKAILLQIALFPFTYKASSAFFITAYVIPGGFIQKISITTLLIITLFVILVVKKKITRPSNKEWRMFEKILLIFASSLTVTQFFNHTIYSAIWLSIGAIWQFVFLFYILSSIVKTDNDVFNLFNALFIFFFINVLVRVFGEGQIIAQGLGRGIQRVGAGAMGPAVSYGGYLAVLITASLALYRTKKKLLYICLLIILFVELLNTFTRGAFLTLFFLILIPIWKSERKYFIIVLLVSVPVLILFGDIIWKYASYRGLSIDSNIINLENVQDRLSLIRIYFMEKFDFSFFGNGIGNLTMISMREKLFSPHNIMIAYLSETGVIVTILFLLCFIFSCYVSFIKSKTQRNDKLSILYVYIFIMLIQWFFFANTTSTLLNVYYPYEASSIFWIILFSPFIINKLEKKTD